MNKETTLKLLNKDGSPNKYKGLDDLKKEELREYIHLLTDTVDRAYLLKEIARFIQSRI